LGAEVGIGPSVTVQSEKYEEGPVSVQPEYKAHLGIGGEVSAEKGEDGKIEVKPRLHAGVISGELGIEIDPNKLPGN
jgi:hypothetical protein